jgi:copper chaperone
MQQIFEVENIKCGGCLNSIRKKLETTPGIERAIPSAEDGVVEVLFDQTQITPTQIVETLSALGYPPVGENSLLRTAKSYMSCMTGRLTE